VGDERGFESINRIGIVHGVNIAVVKRSGETAVQKPRAAIIWAE
jgi:hypothetical protein